MTEEQKHRIFRDPSVEKGNNLKSRTHFPEYSGENRVKKVQTV